MSKAAPRVQLPNRLGNPPTPRRDPQADLRFLILATREMVSVRSTGFAVRYVQMYDALLHRAHDVCAEFDVAHSKFLEASRVQETIEDLIAEIKTLEADLHTEATPKRRRELRRAIYAKRSIGLSRLRQAELLYNDFGSGSDAFDLASHELLRVASDIEKMQSSQRWLRWRAASLAVIPVTARAAMLAALLGVTIVLDRTTSLFEKFTQTAAGFATHDLALLGAFAVQLLLFEPVFQRSQSRLFTGLFFQAYRSYCRVRDRLDAIETKLSLQMLTVERLTAQPAAVKSGGDALASRTGGPAGEEREERDQVTPSSWASSPTSAPPPRASV